MAHIDAQKRAGQEGFVSTGCSIDESADHREETMIGAEKSLMKRLRSASQQDTTLYGKVAYASDEILARAIGDDAAIYDAILQSGNAAALKELLIGLNSRIPDSSGKKKAEKDRRDRQVARSRGPCTPRCATSKAKPGGVPPPLFWSRGR